MRTPEFSFRTAAGRSIAVHSTNQILRAGDVDVRGGKTGFIGRAGYCLATLLRLPQGGPSLAVVVLGVLCTSIAYILYFRLIEQAGPSRALAVTFALPVFALLYGALFLGEQVTPWMVMWGGVVLFGTALSTGLLKVPALRAQA